MVERFSAECRCRVKNRGARILGSASSVTIRDTKMRLLDPTARRRRRDSEPVMMSMSRMCTEKQLVCSESQSDPPQGQTSEPSITAQISDMLQQSSTRIWQNPSGYFTEEAPMRTQRRKEDLQGGNARAGWQAPLHLSEALITTLCIWDVERRRTNKIRIRAAELARPPRQKTH